MNKKDASPNRLLPQLFRSEYSKMTAVLCRRFGLSYIEIAEDIVSDTFLKAAEMWGINGIPENPSAWLYTAAKNKTKDHLKRLTVFETKIAGAISKEEFQKKNDFDFTERTIADSLLAVIFAVCDPVNTAETQISLALQILCGFSIEEIAAAFLTKTETIKKRLFRGRKKLREINFQIDALNENNLRARLDSVLSTLYLLFNEGCYSKSASQLIRKDLCLEAIRLTLILSENPITNTTKANALLALMCFQSSRLDARTVNPGEVVLYEEQDRNLWSKELIDRGNYYLVNACTGNEISKFHLEAAIAYWHTTPTDNNRWKHIIDLYNQLLLIEYSPITALNRAFAYAKVFGNSAAITETEKLKLDGMSDYHSLLGYLYSEHDNMRAISHYKKALALTKSLMEKKTLEARINPLK